MGVGKEGVEACPVYVGGGRGEGEVEVVEEGGGVGEVARGGEEGGG